MPTYEYRCENCGYEFEKFQSMTASVLRKCPECGKNSLRRLIGTGAGVIFKGSGFYETDYRSESYKSAAKKDSESSTKKDEKKEAKTEAKTKPDKKKDTRPKGDKKSD
ncbi:MAG: zinc ribbon domain-containing protein [Sedimentisphaerales bacterium]|nr:zinc ribbon domain-containing protein [Sedimentisphaerales bacterium]